MKLLERSVHCGVEQRYYAYVPPALRLRDLALVAVHGIARNAREQCEHLAACATALGCTLVAPLFAEDTARGYQRLGWSRGEQRADLLLESCLADLGSELGTRYTRLILCGYSGGAQFAHRYAMTQPRRVLAQVLGAAGWYTWPDPAQRFPYGISLRGRRVDRSIDLDAYLAVPALLLLGAQDQQRDESLRRHSALDDLQGPHRLERARRWLRVINAAAVQRGLPAPAELLELPNVGHDFAELMNAGGAVHVQEWLRQRLDQQRAPAGCGSGAGPAGLRAVAG